MLREWKRGGCLRTLHFPLPADLLWSPGGIFDKCLSPISLTVPSLPFRNNSRRERFILAHSLEDLSPSRQGRHGRAAQTRVVGIGDGVTVSQEPRLHFNPGLEYNPPAPATYFYSQVLPPPKGSTVSQPREHGPGPVR